MKAGTTTLYKILREHPDISVSKIKETNFFSRSPDWKKELPRYHKLFKQGYGKIYGEASPSYSGYPKSGEIWNDIYEYNPDMKIIYMIRNPYERSISHYMHVYERGYTDLPIEKAFEEIPRLINCSRYYYQIKPYIEKFGKEQVFLIDFEDFIKDRKTVIRKLSEFLEIDSDAFPPFENIHANRSVGDVKLPPRYDKLVRFLTPTARHVPEPIRLKIKKLFADRSRSFSQKPEMPKTARENMTQHMITEIPELEKLLNKKLIHWK